MSLLGQVDQLANELRFAEYIRNKLNGIRLVHEHESMTFERVLRLATGRICTACRGYGTTLSGGHCDACDGKGAMNVAKADAECSSPPAETTPEPEAPLLCAGCSETGKRSHAACGVSGCECFCGRVRAVTGDEARALIERAETTPAPVRVESKRSCNLHADCNAADSRARADGRPKGVGHCNDADCSDHQ